MPARILIADDDPDIRLLLRAELEPLYRVIEARDGREAWKLIQEKRPVLIVTDLGMPGIDGLELTKLVKTSEDEELAGTPVVILTGATVSDALPSGFWLKGTNADMFFEKPFDPATLRAGLDRLIKRRMNWKELPPGQGFYEGEQPV
ncbi:MAG: response regulator [Sumerlaeia bacterium]